jgi:hypothetical protein
MHETTGTIFGICLCDDCLADRAYENSSSVSLLNDLWQAPNHFVCAVTNKKTPPQCSLL